MYPLNLEQPYPRNQWWVGAMSHEVSRTLLQRKILGDPIVFYRTEAGEPVALFGLCPHRLYPLALSTLSGDAVRCGYHGFTFNAQGACVEVPSQDTIPKNFKTRVYPTVERGQWIWVWTGDPALADPALIPDAPGVFKDGWETSLSSLVTYPARYQLLLDNLLDLTHLGFIHASIVGDVNAFVKTQPQVNEGAGCFSLVREARQMPYGEFGAFMFGADGSTFYDTRQVSDYYGPSLVVTGGPFTQRADISPTGQARELGCMYFLHAVTPETPTSMHYFGGISRNFRLGDAAYTDIQVKNYEAVRDQDVVALSAIEPYIDTFASTAKEISAFQDGGAIRVRRLLAAQIEAEQARRR